MDSWCSVASQPSLHGGFPACERPCLKIYHCPPVLHAHKHVSTSTPHTERETETEKDKYVYAEVGSSVGGAEVSQFQSSHSSCGGVVEKAGPICFRARGIQVVVGEVQDLRRSRRSPRRSCSLCILYYQPHHLGFVS